MFQRLSASLRRIRQTCALYVEPVCLALVDIRDTMVERHTERAEKLLPVCAVWAFFLTFGGQGIRNLVGWFAFAAIAALSLLILAALFVTAGRQLSLRRLPMLPCAFVALCCLSVVWSHFPLETVAASMLSVATTVTGIFLAVAFPLRELLSYLISALKWILGTSLALELFVEVFVGHRIAPVYMWSWEHIPEMYYWVNSLLFEGGPIQGIVGNRNPLAFIALLCLIGVVLTWLDTRTHTLGTVVWSSICLLVLALTRSATVLLALLACLAVGVGALILRRVDVKYRFRALVFLLVCAMLIAIGSLFFHDHISEFVARSPDMSGRGVIWERLLRLWALHPFVGWGWVMYWPPWIPMFKNLVVRADGTPTMSAHNSYIEALFQTGILGAVIVIAAVVIVAFRIFYCAYVNLDKSLYFLLPAVLMVALIVQSFTESRLLSEGNWVLFVAFATWLVVRVRSDNADVSVRKKSVDFSVPMPA
ncbi:O-antigen ligase family protein [Schaalia sp. lx-260]|uniref:O-antigen ligase family protein n=1 Tax=Schaalia sp. lx-260 TaxID=2899082 RepID=UPI001E3B7438|nr:O-antigen ligase family protein [Schaalia sp. lx-260]MCD4550147.1 O-antigen ligase family protein [Schaalia sp. lx-260]